jgi:ATP-dependent Clp protease, protease subunit
MLAPANEQGSRRWRTVSGEAGCTPSERTRTPGGFEGQATDIEIQAREVIGVKRRLEEIIAQHTGQPLERVSKDMERDYFMTPEEAREYGIIDRVIAHR